jgi:predicted transcriptional regulator
MKILVESKDINTYRYLVNNDLFKHLEVAYRLNRNKSNLVESAFRNFFECLTSDMPKKIIGYLN